MSQRNVAFSVTFTLVLGVAASVLLAQNRTRSESVAQLIDNERVTVARIIAAPGSHQDLHTSPRDLVAIQATDGQIEVAIGNEKVSGVRGKAFFLPKTMEHGVSNLGTTPVEMIVVTLK